MAENPERRRPDLRRGYGGESGEEEARGPRRGAGRVSASKR